MRPRAQTTLIWTRARESFPSAVRDDHIPWLCCSKRKWKCVTIIYIYIYIWQHSINIMINWTILFSVWTLSKFRLCWYWYWTRLTHSQIFKYRIKNREMKLMVNHLVFFKLEWRRRKKFRVLDLWSEIQSELSPLRSGWQIVALVSI